MRILLDKQTAFGIIGALRVGPGLRAKALTWQVARDQGYNLAEITSLTFRSFSAAKEQVVCKPGRLAEMPRALLALHCCAPAFRSLE